jgi:putative ABC transport system permease protein
MLAFYRQLESALGALPGMRAVGLATDLPLQGWNIGQPFEIVGDVPTDPSSRRSAHYQMVSARYFDALGILILRGRAFDERDRATSAPVCIVNEEFVRRHLGGREPIGTMVQVPNVAQGATPPVAREIVGVIKQVAIQAGESEKSVELYVPLEQNAWSSTAIALRAEGDPRAWAVPARLAIAQIDRDLPVTRVRTMREIEAESVTRPRFRAGLVGTFAVLALTLAAIGIFGVLTFSVRERTREFGIRLALGARVGDVMWLIVGSGARIAGVGIALGLLLSSVLTRSLASLLYGVAPLDPITYAAVSGTVTVTALVACITPGWSALHTDPAVTLRQE